MILLIYEGVALISETMWIMSLVSLKYTKCHIPSLKKLNRHVPIFNINYSCFLSSLQYELTSTAEFYSTVA